MKIRYDKQDDVFMIWFSKDQVDHAEQSKDVIVHFTKHNKPVLMEILDASQFFNIASKELPNEIKSKYFTAV